MTFLDSLPDLTGMGFTQRDLDAARAFWSTELTRLEPNWLARPSGVFRVHWNNNSAHGAAYFIRLHRLFRELRDAVTPDSWVRLDLRLQRLVEARTEEAYRAVLTELQAAGDLASRMQPIRFDPMVAPGTTDSSNEPPTPDFLVRFASGQLFIEVTILHIGYHQDWAQAEDTLARLAIALLRKKKQRLILSFRLPLSFRPRDLPRRQLQALIDTMANEDSGRLHTSGSGKDIEVMWAPLPHFHTADPHFPIPPGTRYGTFGIDGGPPMGILWAEDANFINANVHFSGPRGDQASGPAAVIESFPAGEALDAQILTSLRNTLKAKRQQFQERAPYLLMLGSGDFRIPGQTVRRLIEERIWPNSEHAWISAICFYAPMDLQQGRPSAHLGVIYNPRATWPVPQEFLLAAQGEATFRG